ncbi:hypothetical protein [Providencia huashanensis]|uniref:hypothetical protein n=1 Tax=Providencia huashanensis TaxID=3037798 RepID=UPI002AFEDAA1|nr:hypothetical protein [Providencia sp. 23021821]
MRKIALLIALFILSAPTFADCNFKKATRNKMLDNQVGISGSCDTEKAAKTQATHKIDESLNIDSKKIKKEGEEKKDKVVKNISTTQKVVNAVK